MVASAVSGSFVSYLAPANSQPSDRYSGAVAGYSAETG